jgi:phosphate-selective porin
VRPPAISLTIALLTTVPAAAAQAPDSSRTAERIRLSGYLQARETYQDGRGLSASINRARLAAGGAIAHGVSWLVQGEFRTGSTGTGKASVSLQDALIRYAHGPWAAQVGQFKTPFARELLLSLADVETADRSTAVDSLAPKRDIGLMVSYELRKLATLSVGAFNGEGQNVTSNADSSVLGVARLAVQPLATVAIGVNAARYFGDSTRFGADATYQDDRVVARAEWLTQTRDRVDAPADDGWYALAGYFLVPEVQLVARYERFARDGVDRQQRNHAWTAATNLYPWGRRFRINLEYVWRTIGDPGRRSGQVLVQVQVRF